MQKKAKPSQEELVQENQKLKAKVDELEEIFRAIRQDEVDALIINTPMGDRVFTLRGADQSYRVLIEQMKEGAAMLSKNVQTVLYANNSLANMLALPLEKVAGHSIREHVAPSHLKTFEELLEESKKGKNKTSKEVNLRRSDGTLIPTIMSLTHISLDGAEATYAVVTDLTEHMEDEVKRYTQRLETEVKQKTDALKDAERMVAIGQTAGMVGHDIRNPLQTIIGELFLARDELKQMPEGPSQKQMKEMLETIEEQTLYINKIVTDLQDFTKPAIPHLTQTNIEALVKDTLKTIKIPTTITTSIKIQKNLPDLLIDPSMTQRILTNLLANAVQAIPETGEISIVASSQNQHAIIAVTDTGTGIQDEIKPNIFRPLFTTKARGQGFGLAVVKRLVEAQNGEITFQSEKGKGTTFTVKLPTQNNKP